MAAGAATGQPCAEADEEASDEHPGGLPGRSPSHHLIEHAERPGRTPSAAQECGEKPTKNKPGEKRKSPRPAARHGTAPKVGLCQYQAANVFEAAGNTEATIPDKQERQCDGGDRSTGD